MVSPSGPAAPDSPSRPPAFRALVALGLTLLLGGVFWLFLEVLLVASAWPPAESPPRQGEALLAASLETGQPQHAPEALARSVREPQNAWSCLAFVFVAGWLLTGARDALGRWFAVTVATAGVSALLYHASATREFRQFDVASLYWACALISVLAAVRLRALPARCGRGVAAFILWALTGAAAIIAMLSRNVVVAGFKPLAVPVVATAVAMLMGSLLLVFCLREGDPRKWRLGLGAMAAMGVGFLLEYGDRPGGAWCVPGSWVQPHALWHVLAALGLGLALECFESPPRAREGRVVT